MSLPRVDIVGERLRRAARHLNLRAGGRWIALASVLGLGIGLAAAVFQAGLDIAHKLLFEEPEAWLGISFGRGGAGGAARILSLLAIPAAGAAASGWLTSRFAPEATGHGTDALVRAYHRAGGRVRFRVAPLKLLASMFTLGTGGSAGREGPVAQFGGTLGSTLSNLLGFDARTRRIMLLSGAAGGIGAIFRAPLGGALFAAEVVYRGPDFEGSAVFPGAIASIVSYATFSALVGQAPLFQMPNLAFQSAKELPFYVVMGLLCAAVGIVYVRVFYGGERMFHRLPLPAPARAALGGAALGALTVLFGFATGHDDLLLGGGYGLVQEAINSGYVSTLLFALAGAKILATTFTISSGGSGGVFAPSLAIGACLGGAFGQAAHAFFPGASPSAAACALVCMGGFFAGVAKTPLTAVILISELAGSYGLLVPLMLVSSIACLLSPRSSIYREQVQARIDSPAHLGELASAALARMRVSDAIDPSVPPPLAPLSTTLGHLILDASLDDARSLAAVDDSGKLAGLISVRELRRAHHDAAHARLTVQDVVRRDVPRVTPDADLRGAVTLLAEAHLDELLVVDRSNRDRALAILSRQDLLCAYQRLVRTAEE